MLWLGLRDTGGGGGEGVVVSWGELDRGYAPIIVYSVSVDTYSYTIIMIVDWRHYNGQNETPPQVLLGDRYVQVVELYW